MLPQRPSEREPFDHVVTIPGHLLRHDDHHGPSFSRPPKL
jgi:hypothetical protein